MTLSLQLWDTDEQSWWKARWLSRLVQSAEELWFKVPAYEEISPRKLDVLLEAHFVHSQVDVARVLDPDSLWVQSDLEQLFQRWKWKTIMVRSNSSLEDGKHSFAWVYKSIRIQCESISDLRAALLEVRDSISSHEAMRYRHNHSLGWDSMGIVIQEFVEGIEWWYGVIHTSIPQVDSIMAVSGGNHEAVTDEKWTRWRSEVYKNWDEETWPNIPKSKRSYIPKLRDISRELEKLHGKSDIEFVIGKNGEIYLVQLRSLNIPPVAPMIQWAEMITRLHHWCAAYFVWLPVLVVKSLENLAMQWVKNPLDIPELRGFFDAIPLFNDKGEQVGTQSRQELANALHGIDPTLRSQGVWDWWDTIAEFNKAHPEWFILSIPNWLPKWFGWLPWSLGWAREAVNKALFSNMRAMVVTAFQSTHSDGLAHTHIRAREEEVPMISIVDNHLFGTNKVELKTGDILSIREWNLVRDKKSESIEATNLLEDFPGIHIRETEYGPEILFPGIQVQMGKFYNFLATWLTKKKWIAYSKVTLWEVIWCDYESSEGYSRVEIRGFKMHPKYWALQIDWDFKKLWLMASLQEEYGLKVDNARYLEDFQEEVY